MEIIIDIILEIVFGIIEFVWGEKTAPIWIKVICGIIVFGGYVFLLSFLIYGAINSEKQGTQIFFAGVAVIVALAGIGGFAYKLHKYREEDER